jgi:hypothetical protein
MQNADEALMAAGFGAYEASAYCPMLTKSPANGYQIARLSDKCARSCVGVKETHAGQMSALRKARE